MSIFKKMIRGKVKNTSINLFEVQYLALKELDLDTSKLIRHLIEEYLIKNHNEIYVKIKRSSKQGVQND